MTDLITALKASINPILEVRELLGAHKHDVFILTRIWLEKKGRGTVSDSVALVTPKPNIVDFSHSKSLKEAGNIKQGDIIIKMISKQTYSNESDINCNSSDSLIEKFYYINESLYNVISVTEDHLWWNVQLRKTNDQRIYL